MSSISPLLNPDDEEWVRLVGRYILNMGAVEASTRVLVAIHERSDRVPTMSADLPSRIGFLRSRFPHVPPDRHSWAMGVFAVARKHVGFRNIVAHSPLMFTGHQGGPKHIQGILNLTPRDDKQAGELVGLAELRHRVDESAKLGMQLLEMQDDYQHAGCR